MARTNVRRKRTQAETAAPATHEGGVAMRQSAELELTRTVSSCLLYENTFYESGPQIAERIAKLCQDVPAETIADLAVRAREELYLRHAPLWLTVNLAKLHQGKLVGDTIARVIRRPDELGEFVSLYYGGDDRRKTGQKLTKQARRGLALAFEKFDAYQLAKYDRAEGVRLRDVMFLTHPRPVIMGTEAAILPGVEKRAYRRGKVLRHLTDQGAVWQKLVAKTLEAPGTWENLLSAGADKKVAFEGLLREKKLGALALIRNLRNMEQAGVNRGLIEEALAGMKRWGILPFQFVAALKAAPAFLKPLEHAMLKAVAEQPKLGGTTALVVDVSGSMNAELSNRGAMNRIDAAAALGILLKAVCEEVYVYTFSDRLVPVAAYDGFALIDAIHQSQDHSGTWLERALETLKTRAEAKKFDRVIVISDEQAHDGIAAAFAKHSYVVNVAPYAPALDTPRNGWVRVNGFSDRIADWIRVEETGVWKVPVSSETEQSH